MRSFLLFVLGALNVSAFETFKPNGTSEGVFPPQTKGPQMTVLQSIGASLVMSGTALPISTGTSPINNSTNGTYMNAIRPPGTGSKTIKYSPPAQQLDPTSAGLYTTVTEELQVLSTTWYQSVVTVPTPSPIKLAPTVAPERNPSDPQNVVPKVQVGLDYAESVNSDSNDANRAASVNVEFQYPTVVLEHVDSISNVTCPSSNKLVVEFTNTDLFHKAVNSWPRSDFYLINNADGCGDSSDQRSLFWTTNYTSDSGSLTIETTGQMLGLNDPGAVKNFKAQFGHYASAQAVPSPATTQTPQKRDPSPKAWFGGAIKSDITSKESAVKSDITSKASAVNSDITSKETAVKSDITSKASAVKSGANSFASAAEKGFSKGATETISFSDGPKPTELSQSPFGQAEKLTTVDGLTIWCVDCGASGTIDLSGEIATNLDELTAGSLDFQALDFKIPLTFGFEVKGMTISHDLKHQLPEIPLTPFEVEPFFSIGPKLTFAIDLNVAVSATGNLKAGVNMHWPNASASMDIVKNDSKTLQKGGWVPDVEKVFDFSGGEMAVNASLSIPMSFDIGLSLWNHPVSKNVSITDRPAVQLDSNFNVPGKSRRDHVRDLKVRDKQCPDGVDETIGFTNNVNVNVLGLWSTQLESFSTSLWSTCIKTAEHSTPSSSSPSTAPVKATTSTFRNSIPTSTPSVGFPVLSTVLPNPTGGSGSTGTAPKYFNSTATASNTFVNPPSYGTSLPTLTDSSGSTGSVPKNYNSTATASDTFTQFPSYGTSLPTSSFPPPPPSIPTASTNPSGPTALSSTQATGASGSTAPSGVAGPSAYVMKRGGLDSVVREIRARSGH